LADNSLPEIMSISLDEFEDAYPTWLQWRATDRRFLPTDLRRQPEPLMSNILYIDSIFEKMVAQVLDRYREKNA